MNIGVLGGTFDPVHRGHIEIAEEVRKHLGLDEVLFIPAGQPWLNKTGPVTAAEHRVQMLRLAIKGKPYFHLATIEIDELPSNMADTVADILAELPLGDEIYLILSWDTLGGLSRWWQPEQLINMCRIVAVPRPGYPRPEMETLEDAIPGLSRSITLLDRPEVNISATEIRERVARGEPISHLVPEAVEEYIMQHKLYK
ncbi:nicotinate-nucleotide adenylyltransferase [Chloroflexota bacterium]